ncbi:hypothetical protein SSX86_022856 [Deinandra increscens subsp. villosa]|uniref:BRCT domain-containing protein n=1 Tax=Deinandra increscens subsp. villosa TaxID=3103831 RepID=A0AAP0CJT6_9ASTR
MGSLLAGFRLPHFSEEEAWLPAWLQPSSIKDQALERLSGQGLEEVGCFLSSILSIATLLLLRYEYISACLHILPDIEYHEKKHANLSKKSLGETLTEIGRLQQNIGTTENGNSSDGGMCKSLRLFLSEEDNSPINFPSCSSNVEVPFHLHLSSNEESQYSLNPTWSRSQTDKSESNQPLLVQQSEAIVIPEGEAYVVRSQQKVNLGITGAKSPSFGEQKEVNPSVDARCCKADISDAIELTVAASEALTIHEVLKDELIASYVLEAAIRVKQARLENFSDDLGSPIEESNEADCAFLSYLDHLAMADAYEDVGLTVTGHGDLSAYGSISHVNDSFASENYISNAQHKCNEHGGLEIELGSSSPKQQEQVNNAKISSQGSILEAIECATRKDHLDYESLGTENANLACDVDQVFNCSTEQTDFCATEQVGLQREGFPNKDLTSSHTILRSNEREDKVTELVPDRFQSRWFGGWTCKNEVSVPTVTNDKYKRSVPELFANEMSSLSESADIAPDMSSCMQRQDKYKTVSQSSVAPQYASEKANNNGDLISDDVAVSPTVSPMDPLCSVVPCSFTSDSLVSHNSQDQVNLEKHLDPTVEPSLDNVEVNGESSPTVRRQVASLKTYSMLYPSRDPYLDKEHTCGESSSSSFEHNRTAKVDTELTSQREKEVFQKVESIVPRRKRVRFLETEISYPQIKKFRKTPQARLKDPLVASRIFRRLATSKTASGSHLEVKKPHDKALLFHDLKFLLTGFSVKMHKQIKNLIQNNGGMVFDDIPSPPTSRRKRCQKLPPLILCPKKLLTTKFLYGCAVNAGILNVAWLFDSVDEGLILPHQKYKVLNDHASDNRRSTIGNPNHFIFDDIAIMLHGKPDFCRKMAIVIKHGGGSVFKTFHWLVKSLDSKKVSMGVIVVEDENGISRQLRQCALEQKIPMMPYNWIISSLYAGRLLPSLQSELPDHPIQLEMSEEI